MTTLESIQASITPQLNSLDKLIRTQLASSNPLMDKVIDNYLKTKGKLIRPVIVLLTAQMVGDITPRVLAAAASVELLHNASLIHDDIVDHAPTRRGQPTINAVWDNHIAVLVGDFFVSSSMQQAISTGDVRIIEALCHLGKLLSLGELDQIYNARYHTLTEDAYYQIINYKTASLFVACAKMGSYACNVDDNRTKVLSNFAEALGMCFQIRDDIFDYFTVEVGKPTGNDLRDGKITLPLLHTLLTDTNPDHDSMVQLARKEQLSHDEIETLIAYARDNGGIDYAYRCMAQMRDKAVADLCNTFDDTPKRQTLIDLFDYVIERRF